MDLRFHPRTKKQRDLRFEPREQGCGYPGFIPPEPPPPPLEPPWSLMVPRRRPSRALGTLMGVDANGQPITLTTSLTFSGYWSSGAYTFAVLKGRDTETEPPPPPKPNAIWDEGPGSLFD